jgi:hypothetical protein
MSKAGYATQTEAAVALAAATAKSIVGVLAPAQFGCDLIGFDVSFDGVTASATPVLVELCACTFATNPPSTNSTGTTVDQAYGRAITAGFTAAANWTTEPTVVTPLREFLVDPNKGLFVFDFPLGQSPDNDVSKGFVLRCNAPAIVNVRAGLRFERC